MIKKIILTALVLLMTSSVFAADMSTEKKLDMLNSIGITDIETDKLPTTSVTEEKFLEYVCNLVSENPKDNYADFAKTEGIIEKNEKISSKGKIEKNKAYTWLENALGYSYEIKNGKSVSRIASEIGLETSLGEKLSAEETVDLLYSALDVKIPKVQINGDSVTISTKDSGNALLNYKKIKSFESVVTATENTSLLQSEGVDLNQIELNYTKYESAYKYSEMLLGSKVTAYVYSPQNGDERLVYIEDKSKETDKLTINAKDILGVLQDMSGIRYEFLNREKTAKLAPALRVVYNGRLYPDYQASDLTPKVGELTLSDTDGDGKFDIVFVTSYETVLVNATSGNKIYNKFTNISDMQIIDLDLDKVYRYKIMADGTEISLSDIKKNMVLSVAKSKDSDPIFNILVSDNHKTLKATRVSNDNKTVIFADDNNEYPISQHYYDLLNTAQPGAKELSASREQTVYFDVFGNVFYVTYDLLDGYSYVYALKIYGSDEEEKSMIKFLDTDNEWQKLYCRTRTKVDGSRIDSGKVYNALGGENFEPQLLTIKIKNGEIDEIKTAFETEKYNPDKFTCTTEAERYYSPRNKSFYCMHYIDADTKVFVIPATHTYDEDDYYVDTVSFFVRGGNFKYKVYDVDDFNVAKAIVVRNTKLTDFTYIPFCVTDMTTTLDADDEPVRSIIGNYNGTFNIPVQVDKRYEQNVGDYKRGDVILIKLDNGKIINTILKYTLSDGKKKQNPTQNDKNALITGTPDYIQGIVTAVDSDRRMIKIDCGGDLVVYVDRKVKMQSYTNGEKNFEPSSINDICVGDYILVAVNNYRTDYIILYKDF